MGTLNGMYQMYHKQIRKVSLTTKPKTLPKAVNKSFEMSWMIIKIFILKISRKTELLGRTLTWFPNIRLGCHNVITKQTRVSPNVSIYIWEKFEDKKLRVKNISDPVLTTNLFSVFLFFFCVVYFCN